MREVKQEIDQERYKTYYNMPYREFNNMIEDSISDSWRYGYGWYGCRLFAEDDKYYIIHKLGESCD